MSDDFASCTRLRQTIAALESLLPTYKKDTKRLDLLIEILKKHELGRCSAGYSFFPKKAHDNPIIHAFFPTVRDLLDAVKEYK